MRVVHVHVHVKAEAVEAFKAATIENASESVKEAGVVRFDVLQDTTDSTRFVLIEIYRTLEAPAAHKATTHYVKWRDAVAGMMAVPRTSHVYSMIFPT